MKQGVPGSGKVEIDTEETVNRLSFVANNRVLSELMACHLADFTNPHQTTAEQAGALESVNGVRRDENGNVELVKDNTITVDVIKTDDNKKQIKIGETHSSDTDNPHKSLVGLEAEPDKVYNKNGYITIDKSNAITLSPDKINHKITIGETHSARTDNPHKSLVGLKAEEKEVYNDNGYITIDKSGDITLTPDIKNHKITIGETHSAETGNPHQTKHSDIDDVLAIDPETPGSERVKHVSNDDAIKWNKFVEESGVRSIAGVVHHDGDVGLVAENSIVITPDDVNNKITFGETHSAETGNPHQTKHADIIDALPVFGDKDNETKNKHISNNDAVEWNKASDHSIENGNPHQTGHSELDGVLGISITAETGPDDDVRDKHISNNDAKKWNEAVERPAGGEISGEGGMLTGSLYVKTTDWSAISGTATKTHGVMGQLTEDIETGSSYRCAGVVGVSEIEGKHGVYARAPEGTYALYVRGTAHFTGGTSGCRLNTFVNASGEALNTGDVVRLEGTPVAQFIGEDNEIPLAKVTFADETNANLTIGIVHRKAVPLGEVPGTGTGTGDPSTIADGEELFVVNHGCYAHCKVDVSGGSIKVGDLLTPSADPGYARKAVEPKIGSMIGKALESFSGGEGEGPYIAVFVNIQ